VLLLAGLGKGVTAARPLDGGALTRWGARTQARGPAAVPWMPASLHHSLSSGSVPMRLRRESKRERRERRRKKRERAAKKE